MFPCYNLAMPTSTAAIVQDSLDPDSLPPNMQIRACRVCPNDFLIDVEVPADRARAYCCQKCKNKGQSIRNYLRKHMYHDATRAEYVADPSKFPPRGWFAHQAPVKVPEIPNHLDRPIMSEKKGGVGGKQSSSPERQKEHYNRANKRHIEALKYEQEKMKKESAEAEREAAAKQAESLQAATKALEILPLAEQPDVFTGKLVRFNDSELTIIRSNAMTIVQNNMLIVEKVLSGEVTWSPVQANLFTKLLNKVVPDASRNSTPPEEKPLSELSMAELEALAQRMKTSETPSPAPKQEKSDG